MLIEIIGIVATLLILASMCFKTTTLKGNLWMRGINIVGSIVFAVYGFLLPAYSTGALNTVLVVVNAYHFVLTIKTHKENQLKELVEQEFEAQELLEQYENEQVENNKPTKKTSTKKSTKTQSK